MDTEAVKLKRNEILSACLYCQDPVRVVRSRSKIMVCELHYARQHTCHAYTTTRTHTRNRDVISRDPEVSGSTWAVYYRKLRKLKAAVKAAKEARSKKPLDGSPPQT